jgi:hypothetical protein
MLGVAMRRPRGNTYPVHRVLIVVHTDAKNKDIQLKACYNSKEVVYRAHCD